MLFRVNARWPMRLIPNENLKIFKSNYKSFLTELWPKFGCTIQLEKERECYKHFELNSNMLKHIH